MPAVSSVSTRRGAREINGLNLVFGYNDVGGVLAQLVSAVAILNTSMAVLTAAAASANASGVTFSALSGVTFTQPLSPTNLQA